MRLEGKTAIITGAANGIGAEISRLYAQEGAKVVLADLALEKAQEAADAIGFPALIKPNISVGARGITMVYSLSDLQDKYDGILRKYGECTLQEYIDNSGAPYYNVMMYRNAKGNIINTVIIEIIRYYPIKGGSSSFCRTVE